MGLLGGKPFAVAIGSGLLCSAAGTCPAEWYPAPSSNAMYKGKEYFIADPLQSCDSACTRIEKTCDQAAINAVAASLDECKAVITTMGYEFKNQLRAPDDNSGCTFGDWGNGYTAAQLMMKNDQNPTCSQVNIDQNRRRVCSCAGSSAAQSLQVGSRVVSLTASGAWKPASVQSVNDADFTVTYDDGSSQDTLRTAGQLMDLAGITTALQDLIDIITGSTAAPSAADWPAQIAKFTKSQDLIDADEAVISKAFLVVSSYESVKGPLFMNTETKDAAMKRDGSDKYLDRAVLLVQQQLVDKLYHSTVAMESCSAVLKGWETAKFFPGYVAPPADSSVKHSVRINGRVRAYWGHRVAFAAQPVLRPTGLYLAPGEVATVKIPLALVSAGFKVQVGAHVADHSNKAEFRRMDRITTLIALTKEITTVSNPLGGGLYILVPYESDHGTVTVEISGGVVKAPFFQRTSLGHTSESEWTASRAHPGPWADLVTDTFFMQVPRVWIYAYDFAQINDLMIKWDTAMDGTNEFSGFYGETFHKDQYTLYLQPDISIRHNVYGIGYPQVNVEVAANPGPDGAVGPLSSPSTALGKAEHWFVTDPQASYVCYHELGHAMLPTMYFGETEALNNFLMVYVRNVKFGIDYDRAFAESLHDPVTPDQAAIDWMVTPNFREGKEMDKSNTERDEYRYQQRGYAKYSDFVKLFGWDTFKAFNHQHNLDYEKEGFVKPMDGQQPAPHAPGASLPHSDGRTLRLSVAADVDLRPLIEFWGIFPEKPADLEAEIQKHQLNVSCAVREHLERLQALIPKDNAAFKRHFASMSYGGVSGPSVTSCPSPLYGCGWYKQWADKWDATLAAAASARVDTVIAKYYADAGCGALKLPPGNDGITSGTVRVAWSFSLAAALLYILAQP